MSESQSQSVSQSQLTRKEGSPTPACSSARRGETVEAATTTTEIAWEAIARVSGAEARKKRGRKGSRQNEECYSPFASPLAVRPRPSSLPPQFPTFFLRALFLAEDGESEREEGTREAAAAAVTEITSQPRTCFSVLTCGEVELRARSENQTRGTRALVIRGRGVEELIFVDFDIGRIFGCEQ